MYVHVCNIDYITPCIIMIFKSLQFSFNKEYQQEAQREIKVYARHAALCAL